MNNKTEVNREQLQLKVIEFLRFPLIVGVVLIHTQVTKINGVVGDIAAPYPFNGVYPLYEFFHCLFVNIITRVAVPLFFVFSGYLFFYKNRSFTSGTYFMKLKKRVRSLLVPYLFWITLLALYYVILDKFVLEEPLYLTSVDGLYSIFYNFNKTGYPISIQFWYIRDLMVTILLSPIIYWLIKKCHIYFVIVLSVLWITNYWPLITGLNITALFFFSLGAYFSICRKNFIEIIRPHIFSISLLYILIIIILLYCRNCEHIVYVNRIGIVLGMAFFLGFSAVCLDKGWCKVNLFLSESSFFIYCSHIILLSVIGIFLSDIISIKSDLGAIIYHILSASISVFLGMIIYRVLKMCMPKFTCFITGGR